MLIKKDFIILAVALAIGPIQAAFAGHDATMMPSWQIQQGDDAYSRGQWYTAIGYYHRAVEMDPHDSVAYSKLGYAFYHSGQVKQAADEFMTALNLHPHLSMAENGLDLTFQTPDQRIAYENQLEQKAQQNPSDINAITAWAEALMDRMQVDLAKTQALAALKISPGFGHAHCVLGRAELAEGDVSDAHADLETAVKYDRHDDDAWAALGDIATKANDLNEAVSCYRHAVESSPEDASWHEKLADALAAIGDTDGAAKQRAVIKTLISSSPGN